MAGHIHSFDRPMPLLARKLTVVRTLFLALAFKAARFFVPQKLLDLNPDTAAIDGLASFPFLNTPMILKGLKSELADYLAMVADVAGDVTTVDWWKRHQTDLPNWVSAAQLVALSSASAERVITKFLYRPTRSLPSGLS